MSAQHCIEVRISPVRQEQEAKAKSSGKQERTLSVSTDGVTIYIDSKGIYGQVLN